MEGDPRLRRAEALLSARRYGEAEHACTEVLDREPNNALAYRLRAFARGGKRRDLDGAIADMTEALRIDPASTDFHFNRGFWHLERGNLTDAETDFSSAVEIEGSTGSMWYTGTCIFLRAIARVLLGRCAEARFDLLSVPDEMAWWTLGRLYTKEDVLKMASEPIP